MATIHKENGGLLDYSIESPVSTGAQPDDDFTRQIFDIVTGSVGAAPMAIGKISKAAITGGQVIPYNEITRRMNKFKGLTRDQKATFNKLNKNIFLSYGRFN